MSLFNKNQPSYECKLCYNSFSSDHYVFEYNICVGCFSIMQSKVSTLLEFLPELQEKANNAIDADEKIVYLKSMLELLYEYKILYFDNDVDVIEQNVSDLIDEVIDCISEARL